METLRSRGDTKTLAFLELEMATVESHYKTE